MLRVLEEREIEKVGSSKPIPIDVRLIASTKRDLKDLVKEGKFREDLYYRLKVFPINLPPLRARKNDISYLINYYINKFSYINKVQIEPSALEALIHYDWPGNIRELKNLIERLVLLATDGVITKSLLPNSIFTQPLSITNIQTDGLKKPLAETISDVEITLIKNALSKAHNNKAKAAQILGIPPSTLRTKMDKYNLE